MLKKTSLSGRLSPFFVLLGGDSEGAYEPAIFPAGFFQGWAVKLMFSFSNLFLSKPMAFCQGLWVISDFNMDSESRCSASSNIWQLETTSKTVPMATSYTHRDPNLKLRNEQQRPFPSVGTYIDNCWYWMAYFMWHSMTTRCRLRVASIIVLVQLLRFRKRSDQKCLSPHGLFLKAFATDRFLRNREIREVIASWLNLSKMIFKGWTWSSCVPLEIHHNSREWCGAHWGSSCHWWFRLRHTQDT